MPGLEIVAKPPERILDPSGPATNSTCSDNSVLAALTSRLVRASLCSGVIRYGKIRWSSFAPARNLLAITAYQMATPEKSPTITADGDSPPTGMAAAWPRLGQASAPAADAGAPGRWRKPRDCLIVDPMAADTPTMTVTPTELRAVAGYAAACARAVLASFEAARPGDPRPRSAIDAARMFAEGGPRRKAMRDSAWAAQRAAQEARGAGLDAASEAARAAMAAAGAAFLHPLAQATQVKHILGAAAHAARAFELAAGNDPNVGARHLQHFALAADPTVRDVLRRYPPAPPGGGRVGELIWQMDILLR